MILTEKDPAEIITLTFDFSSLATSLSSAVVGVSVLSGAVDASPGAMISGAYSINGPLVMQRIVAGQAGTTYALRCTANDADGEVHVLVAALPVRAAIAT